jgi:hypothetical protein
MSSTHGEMMLKNVRTLSSATAPSIQACQKSSRRRRSKMSAVAPASSPSITTGRLAAVCISAMSSGDGVSTVISQVPAVSCIQPPRFETVDAIQSLRKSGPTGAARSRWRVSLARRGGVELGGGLGGVRLKGMAGRGNHGTSIMIPR